LESTAETQPKLHPALLRLSAIISQYFTFARVRFAFWIPFDDATSFAFTMKAGNVIETDEHAGKFKEW